MGNDLFYSSTLDLPAGEAGYQFLDRDLLFEMVFAAAPVLVGRYSVESAQPRALGGSFAWGGHVAARLRGVHLQVGFVRNEPDTEDSLSTPVDRISGEICGVAKPIALCADTRWFEGDVVRPEGDVASARTVYFGIHFGLVAPRADVVSGATPTSGRRPAKLR